MHPTKWVFTWVNPTEPLNSMGQTLSWHKSLLLCGYQWSYTNLHRLRICPDIL